MKFIKINKVKHLKDNKFELLNTDGNVDSIIELESVNGSFYFDTPSNGKPIVVSKRVFIGKKASFYIGFYKNGDSDPKTYDFPIGKYWVYEEDGVYKFSEKGIDDGIVESEDNKPYSYFPIIAEADLFLEDNPRGAWSYGGGGLKAVANGVVIPFDCELISITLKLSLRTTIEIRTKVNYRNTKKSISTNVEDIKVHTFEDDPVYLIAGDIFQFKTTNSAQGIQQNTGAVIAAWFRKSII
jgi:hypothetical protein